MPNAGDGGRRPSTSDGALQLHAVVDTDALWFYAPCEPTENGNARVLMRPMLSGHNALLVYSSPECYIAACGIDQPCVQLTADQVDDVIANSLADFWVMDLDLNGDFDAMSIEPPPERPSGVPAGGHRNEGRI